jgi:hypothetical protein
MYLRRRIRVLALHGDSASIGCARWYDACLAEQYDDADATMYCAYNRP